MIFDFPLHRFETKYPDSGFRVALGQSYQFTAPPSAPDQRKFTLHFATMKYFANADGTINKLREPKINFALLEDFYNKHKMFAVFLYPHPVYGNVPCRFNKPLEVPKGFVGGNGALESFSLEFVEAPGMIATF